MISSLEDIYGEMPSDTFYAIVDAPGDILTPDLLSEIVGTLGLKDTSLIVDAGCGKGQHGASLAEQTGSRLVAFDPVSRNYRLTAELLTQKGMSDRALAVASMIETMPLPNDMVDLILARDMLNHMPDLPATFSECRRVLRVGGHMLVFTVFATGRLTSADAAEIFPPLAVQPATTDRESFEMTAVQAGLNISRHEIIGSQWREWGEQTGVGRTSAQLLRVARLRRREAELVAEVGQVNYDIELADCLWGVYQMLGKLEPHVYLLEARAFQN